MPLLDQYSTQFILEATAPKRTGELRARKSASGGSGVGVDTIGGGLIPKDTFEKGELSKPWAGTPPAPGTEMPIGADITTQANWAVTKTLVDPMIDYNLNLITYGLGLPGAIGKLKGMGGGDATGLGILGKMIGIGIKSPAQVYALKQSIKADLALDYLGVPSSVGEIERTKSGIGPGTPLSMAVKSSLKDKGLMGGPKHWETSGKPRFGKLGELVAGKVTDMAAMGIDPLDWVTKAFGADAAYAQLAVGIPAKTAATETAGGWLLKGRQRGIY